MPTTPTFTGQLKAGHKNTPMTRMAIEPGRVVFSFWTDKPLAKEQVGAITPYRLPVIGRFFISGVRIKHSSPDFPERLVLQKWGAGAVLDAFEQAGYPVDRGA